MLERKDEAHVNTNSIYTMFLSISSLCLSFSFFNSVSFTSISCSYISKSVISCSLSRSLTPFTSYSDSMLWFLWGRQTLPGASFYKSVYSSKWIREAGELFKLTSLAAVLKCSQPTPRLLSFAPSSRTFIPSSQLMLQSSVR